MKLVFKNRRVEVGGAITFCFSPVEPITWLAGQSIKIELPAGYGAEERRFSISSAPYQKDIYITTKISDSGFKESLNSLKPGTVVDAYSVDGDFIWVEDGRPKLFCASGIGITPFYSMIKQRVHENEPLDLTLLYANRYKDFVFGKELELIEDPTFRLIFLPEQRLSAQKIIKNVPSYKDFLIYLSGPSLMVDEISQELVDSGASEQSLMRDWFTGRAGWEES